MKKLHKFFNILSISLFILLFGIYLYRFLHFKGLDNEDKNYSDVLSERIIEEEKNFKLLNQIEIKDNVYYFKKSTKNNYVKYNDMIWRIVKINQDKTTMLILDEYVTILPYNFIETWINNKYSKLVNIDNLNLLDEETYKESGNKDSFINNKSDFWIKDNKYIDSNGEIKENDELEHKVRPIVVLDKDTKIIDGNGNIDNPFIINKSDEISYIKDIKTSKYIKYNNTIWRIIDIEEDKVKLLNEDTIKDVEGNKIKHTFASYSNDIKNYQKNTVISYLNNYYYNNLENKEFLTSGKFYIGKFINNDYNTIYADFMDLKVGLPNIDDPYIYDSVNTFLLTIDGSNNINAYSLENNKINEMLITNKTYMRPVIYMKNNIEIKEGKGTYSDPYILGGIINEEKN